MIAVAELTILMPCLNEAETLAACIGKAQAWLISHDVDGEVLVADNGSTDGSQAIAADHGARVIDVAIRGYGADAAMTLAAMALYANGTTRLDNIASWRVKETDRIAAMACELRKCGATVTEGADFIEITPPTAWRAAAIHTYDDHRMAMCLSLAAFNPLAGAQPGVPVRILDPRCVGKTFPDYFETLFGVQ